MERPKKVSFRTRAQRLGGAVFSNSSSLSWSGKTFFLSNSVHDGLGGALWLVNGTWSNGSWSGDATFSRNTASSWGGVYVFLGAVVDWSGRATFTTNRASQDGGP